MNATCSVIEAGSPCPNPARTRGWCAKHYGRWLNHGNPLTTAHIVRDHERRFWSKVNKDGPIPERRPDLGQCWVWTAKTDRAGYGQFPMGKSSVYAHRWICEFTNGPIPDGYEVDHLCFNTSCVNYVSHLEVVTSRTNCLRSDGVTAINARKTHCDKGHEFTEANTRWLSNPRRRSCKKCERLRGPAGNATARAKRLAERQAENRRCCRCGADIGHRNRRAVRCEPCALAHRSETQRTTRRAA